MKTASTLLLLTLLASCGQKESVSVINGKDGNSCTTEQLENGLKVSCEDGTFSYAFNGSIGAAGIDGVNGTNCSVDESEDGKITTISCDDGTSSEIVDGKDGIDGKGCAVAPITNGVALNCAGITANILNGTNGTNAHGCTLTHDPNNGAANKSKKDDEDEDSSGNKYKLSCGDLSISFTAKEEV